MKTEKLTITIEVVELTADNLEAAEKWCGGSIKGTSLPREKRCIDLYCVECEERAVIGDRIARYQGVFFVISTTIFSAIQKYRKEFK